MNLTEEQQLLRRILNCFTVNDDEEYLFINDEEAQITIEEIYLYFERKLNA